MLRRPYACYLHGGAANGPKKSAKRPTDEKESKGEKEQKKRCDVWDMSRVISEAAKARRGAQLEEMARWVTSWMLPWERDHMDGMKRELTPLEEMYWLALVVFGGSGLAWELYVVRNSRIFTRWRKIDDQRKMKCSRASIA